MLCANFARTTEHGAIEGKTQTKAIRFYNLDVFISVVNLGRPCLSVVHQPVENRKGFC